MLNFEFEISISFFQFYHITWLMGKKTLLDTLLKQSSIQNTPTYRDAFSYTCLYLFISNIGLAHQNGKVGKMVARADHLRFG